MKRRFNSLQKASPSPSPKSPRYAEVISNPISSSLDYGSEYYIKDESEDKFYIGMRVNDRIIYDGAMKLTAIQGNVNIQGYNLRVGDTFEIASNSTCSSSIPIFCVDGSKSRPKFAPAEITSLLSKYPTIVQIEKCNNPILFNSTINSIPPFMIPGVRIYNNETKLTHQIEIYPSEWKSTIDSIIGNDEIITSPRIVILGSKGTGKSTYSRYMINYLLSKCKENNNNNNTNKKSKKLFNEICFIDIDIGQPEFSPSGFVSLFIINTPVFGIHFQHFRKPILSHYIGSINISVNPSYYTTCCCNLIDYYKEHYSNLPLIINSHGWIKGLGLNTIEAILMKVEELNIIRLQGSNKHQQTDTYDIQYKNCYDINSVTQTTSPDGSSEFNPSSIQNNSYYRDLRILTYFYNKNPFLFNILNGSLLSKLPKYEIPFNKIFFNIIQQTVLPSLYPISLNQTLVALCYSEDIKAKLNENSNNSNNRMNILSNSPVCESYGLGFIDSFDLNKKVVNILSNIEPELVHKANVILRGSINLRNEEMYDFYSDTHPYFTSQCIFGSGEMKSHKTQMRFYKKN